MVSSSDILNAGILVVDDRLVVDLLVRKGTDHGDIVAVVKNSGRRTVRTKGTLVLFDESGAVAREATVPDVPLLPESEREVSVTLTGPATTPLPAGLYRAELKLDLGLAAIIVGETQVQISR